MAGILKQRIEKHKELFEKFATNEALTHCVERPTNEWFDVCNQKKENSEIKQEKNRV